MAEALKSIPESSHPDLLVGYNKADDAGVFKITDEIALVQTLDFFPPIVDDPFAKAQVMAGVELLNNLGTRVQWRTADFAEVVDRIRAVLGEATDAPPHVREVLDDPLPEPHDATAILATERRHRRALGELQTWLDSQPGHEDLNALVRGLVLWDLERELSLLRSGMYRASRKQRS